MNLNLRSPIPSIGSADILAILLRVKLCKCAVFRRYEGQICRRSGNVKSEAILSFKQT